MKLLDLLNAPANIPLRQLRAAKPEPELQPDPFRVTIEVLRTHCNCGATGQAVLSAPLVSYEYPRRRLIHSIPSCMPPRNVEWVWEATDRNVPYCPDCIPTRGGAADSHRPLQLDMFEGACA